MTIKRLKGSKLTIKLHTQKKRQNKNRCKFPTTFLNSLCVIFRFLMFKGLLLIHTDNRAYVIEFLQVIANNLDIIHIVYT